MTKSGSEPAIVRLAAAQSHGSTGVKELIGRVADVFSNSYKILER